MIIHEQKEINKLGSNTPLVIALPFAGGNTYSYRSIMYNLNKKIDIICPELPGRGTYSATRLIKNTHELIHFIFSNWIAHIDLRRPYIIYGHSMGGLLAYLLCHHIRTLGINLPKHLIISGMEGPTITRNNRQLFSLPPHIFWSEIEKIGGTSKEILLSEELKNYFEPILRSDFEIVEGYVYNEVPPLDVPISVFFGSEEDTTFDKMYSWKKETTKELVIQQLSGNHFFLYDHVGKLSSYINNIII